MHFLYILQHTRVKEKSLSKSNLEMDIKPPSTLTLYNISNVYLLHRISLVKSINVDGLESDEWHNIRRLSFLPLPCLQQSSQ